ncbi:MAG TPA: FHA domain-containing protein [Longimicrobium sp.]|nr:FHA domain-containing protein [Longimicrobium sp.]
MATPNPPARQGPLATLALTAGPRYGDELPVPAPVVTVGRAAGCEVRIDDDSVSAQHARLEFDLGAWRITDLGSVNGTSVEGHRLAANVPAPVAYGSTIRFGGVQLQLREAAADVEAARAAYVPPAPARTLKEERRGARFPVWMLLLVLVVLALAGWLVYTSFIAPQNVTLAPASPPAVLLAAGIAAP